ncbi:TPA: ribonuclease HI [bacterium]|nr:ribonuclease HI [bacterium]
MKEVTIYTDGCCIANPGPGGYAAILCYNKHEKEFSGGFRLTTSNRMELMAAIIGLDALKEPCSVRLYSDSKYLVESMVEGWVNNWKANNWFLNRKEKASNTDLWEKLLDLCNNHSVEFTWIRGHAGHHYNEKCDIISWKEAIKENLSIDEGYEKLLESVNQESLDLQPNYQAIKKPKKKLSYKSDKTDEEQIYHVDFEGKIYIWNSQTWFDEQSSIVPPKAVIHRLNSLLEEILEREDDNISDLDQLLKRAREARDSLQYRRGQNLARRVISISHDHLPALSILCSCLRASGHAQQALDETEGFDSANYPPLLNSRASAMCDLGRWEDAKKFRCDR